MQAHNKTAHVGIHTKMYEDDNKYEDRKNHNIFYINLKYHINHWHTINIWRQN